MNRIPIWDPWIRLFHWSLVFCVFFLLFSGKTGNGFYDWHRYVGECVFGLILFRLGWGIWGSSNGRLGSLFTHPAKSWSHLIHLFQRTLTPERGHNPAGGWATLIMLALIGIQATTGFFIADEEEFLEGALYSNVSSDWAEQLLQVHYLNANFIIAMVIVHIVMIFLYWIWAKVNLIKPMLSGSMEWRESSATPAYKPGHWLAGLITLSAAVVATALISGWFQ